MERMRPKRLALVAGGASTADHRPSGNGFPPIKDVDWSILMARGQEGDASAYERLLHDITPYLRALTRKWHSEPSAIEDAVQDILLTVHSIRHTYDPARPFGPWLVGIANRRAIDSLRKRMRHAHREMPLDEALEVGAVQAPEAQVLLDKAHLDHAIEGLPAHQKTAVNLLKIQEMSLAEASLQSGLSIAALKMAMHRAMKNLRVKLMHREGE